MVTCAGQGVDKLPGVAPGRATKLNYGLSRLLGFWNQVTVPSTEAVGLKKNTLTRMGRLLAHGRAQSVPSKPQGYASFPSRTGERAREEESSRMSWGEAEQRLKLQDEAGRLKNKGTRKRSREQLTKRAGARGSVRKMTTHRKRQRI
ncbi:hypothetical protein NDU88_004653 [Pleurodeles waltl]|uniref:Uncharacterized protein n=1 Tax=Pleurodeles waltl TaxID=8319 RepID=A0AAV7T9R5_PLEWA|nr:hypothetical protein NDU88_004653 [Pleurodeles waltl]